MSNIVVSLNNNLLRVSYYGTEGFGGASLELSKDVAKDTHILDIEGFMEPLKSLISQVVPVGVKSHVKLNFLVEPEDVILEFATVSKNGEDVSSQVLSVIQSKLPKGTVLENLYFSYKKIAPFVYQFVGVDKDAIEHYLEISTKLGYELGCISPWVLLLPKLVNDNQPSIFISNADGRQVVVLSELNGVYFTGVYEKEKTQKELEGLVQQLSVYKRTVPITTIYTVNCGSFTLDPSYKVLPLEVATQVEAPDDFEVHLLFNEVFGAKVELLASSANLLTLLPVPVVEKPKVPVVPIGISVAVLLVGVAGYFVVYRGVLAPKASSAGDLAMDVEEAVVLSESAESTPSEEVPVVLSREGLSIRVENGSGITGAAGKLRDRLVALGYDVVAIGDAEISNREITLLNFKEGKKTYENLLSEDMREDYELEVADTLEETADYDVRIVVGLN